MVALLLVILIIVCASGRELVIYDEPREERIPWLGFIAIAGLLMYWMLGQPGMS